MTTSPREALERLTRWRDVGDGPVGYTAGNEAFAADVAALLDLVQKQHEALVRATVHLVGAASAYRTHARRHHTLTPRAVTDPLFTTRAADFERAADSAGMACRTLCLPPAPAEDKP
ncbi:hypothetical protein TSH7_01380 [Azospirillum sp. TSH7]|nr:hypothetical protein TSH7_01380 [Azospirillum sp. TSH7]PWC71384.1 hypothetical protein TSH20_03695 [Azospirillum sp. TSH20]